MGLPPGIKLRRPRLPFSPEEQQTILQGVNRYRYTKPNFWKQILEDDMKGQCILIRRTNVDIKDWFRNYERRLLRTPEEDDESDHDSKSSGSPSVEHDTRSLRTSPSHTYGRPDEDMTGSERPTMSAATAENDNGIHQTACSMEDETRYDTRDETGSVSSSPFP
jgi:hypothetical protein